MIHDHGQVQEVLGARLSTSLTAARDDEGVVELSIGRVREQDVKIDGKKQRIPVPGDGFRVACVLSVEEQAALGAFLRGSEASSSIAFSASIKAPVAEPVEDSIPGESHGIVLGEPEQSISISGLRDALEPEPAPPVPADPMP